MLCFYLFEMSTDPLSAETLFDDFLELCDTAEELQFEDWVKRHPSHEEELRDLYSQEMAVVGRLEGAIRESRDAGASFFRQFSSGRTIPQSPSSASLKEGDVFGDFELLSVLGTGGMGQVWRAREISIDRLVALKFVLPERLNHRTLERFAREGRAGGRLAHGGVVQVHSVGETDGVHWINQELVEGGVTLRDFIDEVRKEETLPEGYYHRIAELTSQLAEALQAVHEADVIHRDIKPQNILIDPDDRPKVTDFGLARITDESALSVSGDFTGTLRYMSPEQVAARRMGIDHRTDIFSLGVVLYELLALQRPFDGDTTHQISEKILTWDPPSLTTLRSKAPESLAVIAGKALEKRPGDRYQTMLDLASDLRHFLASEPIQAKAPGVMRSTRKWARRHPTASVAAGVVAMSLMPTSFFMFQYVGKSEALAASHIDLEQQKLAVEDERDRLQEVVTFQSKLFEGLDPYHLGTKLEGGIREDLIGQLKELGESEETITKRTVALEDVMGPIHFTNVAIEALRHDILDPARKRAAEKLEKDPVIAATLQMAVAETYVNLGLFESAHELVASSLSSRKSELGDSHAETLTSLHVAGMLLLEMGELDRAKVHLLEAFNGRKTTLGIDDPDTLTSMDAVSEVLGALGDYPRALALAEEVLERRRRVLGDSHVDTISSINNTGEVWKSMEEYERALPFYEEALAGYLKLYGEDDAQTLIGLNNLGALYSRMNNLEKATPYTEQALDGRRRVLGKNHPRTLESVNNMAFLHLDKGDFNRAESLFKAALAGYIESFGEYHPASLTIMDNLGFLLVKNKRPEEARPYIEQAFEGRAKLLGDEGFMTLGSAGRVAAVYTTLGRLDEAMALLTSTLASARKSYPPGHQLEWISLKRLARCTAELHKIRPDEGFDEKSADYYAAYLASSGRDK